MEVIGYARTSTAEQIAGLEDQLTELKGAGCTKIFQEQVSSVHGDRPQLDAALMYARDGDTFVVTKPCRLARSTRQLLEIVDDLSQRGVQVRILSMGLDTRSPTARLILTVLGGVAEFERSLMLERQRAGIEKAKSEGRYTGRKPTARAKSAEVLKLHAEGKCPTEIAEALGIGRASVYRAIKDAERPERSQEGAADQRTLVTAD